MRLCLACSKWWPTCTTRWARARGFGSASCSGSSSGTPAHHLEDRCDALVSVSIALTPRAQAARVAAVRVRRLQGRVPQVPALRRHRRCAPPRPLAPCSSFSVQCSLFGVHRRAGPRIVLVHMLGVRLCPPQLHIVLARIWTKRRSDCVFGRLCPESWRARTGTIIAISYQLAERAVRVAALSSRLFLLLCSLLNGRHPSVPVQRVEHTRSE